MTRLAIFRSRPKGVRLVQVAIWAAFFALVVPCGLVISHAAAASAHAALTAHGTTQASSATGGGHPLASGSSTGPGSTGPNATLAKTFGYTSSNATTLLPAFRWRGAAGQLFAKTGTFSVGTSLLSGMSGFILEFGAVVWWVILEIMKFALDSSWLHDAAEPINKGFYDVTQALGAAGLFWIMAVIFALGAIRVILRGRIHQVLNMFLAFVIPLAFVAALAGAINPHAPAGTKGYGPGPKGSPTWIAFTGIGFVNQTLTAVDKGLQTASLGGISPHDKQVLVGAGTNSLGVATAPTCIRYDEALQNQYTQFANSKTSAVTQLGSMSILWQSAFMNYWQQAQFGTGPYSSLPACHLLDANSGKTSAELQTIASIAYKTSGLSRPSAETAALLRTTDGTRSFEAELFGYAACQYKTGSWSTRPGWSTLDEGSGTSSGNTAANCKSWWGTAKGTSQTHKDFYWTTATNLQTGLKKAATKPPATQTNVQNAYNLVYNAWGDVAATRLMNALLGAVVAIIYFWALAPMALGAAVAQIGVMLMLILLPVTLYLMAWPSIKQGDGKHQHAHASGIAELGHRMLRVTIGFLAAQFAILLAVTLLIAIISLMVNITSNFQALDAFGQMFAPLIGLFLLRYLLKKAKIGNITSLSGALAMPAAAGMAMAGEANMRDAMRRTGDSIGSKTGLNRFDRFAKRNNPVGLGARGAKWTAGQAKGALGSTTQAGKTLAKEGIQVAKRKAAVAAAGAVGGPAAAALMDGWQKSKGLRKGQAGYAERLKSIEGASRLAASTKQGQWALGKASSGLDHLSALGMPVQGLSAKVDKTLHPAEVPALQADAKRSLSPGELAMRAHMVGVQRAAMASDHTVRVNVDMPKINLPTVPLNRPTVQHRITVPSIVIKGPSTPPTLSVSGSGAAGPLSRPNPGPSPDRAPKR